MFFFVWSILFLIFWLPIPIENQIVFWCLKASDYTSCCVAGFLQRHLMWLKEQRRNSIEPKMNEGLERTSCNCSTGWKIHFNYKMRVYFLEFFPALCKEAAHRFYFRKLGFFQRANLDLGGWVDSFSRSVHLDRSTEAEGSTPSAIRRPPLPTTYLLKTPLLRNNARVRDVHLTKAAPPQLRQCERVTSDGLTVGLLPNWLSVKERRAIRSPLKYVPPHQTMLF